MANTPPFPALFLLGPPHSGKSVLAYWLSRKLHQQGVAHYLLRAAPDGEGNWFYEGPRGAVIPLRLSAKGRYTRALIERMLHVLQNRHLPLLVDMGGRPRERQWALLQAGTHAVLLYRQPEDLDLWMPQIEKAGLRLLARLHSRLHAADRLTATEPYLQGVIGGLDRRHPRLGSTFERLLARVHTLFAYSEEELEQFHRPTAPYPMVTEVQLAQKMGKPRGARWYPEDLPHAVAHLPQGPVALYGKGPNWLAAALAGARVHHPFALFDAAFGWVEAAPVQEGISSEVRWDLLPLEKGWALAMARLLEPFLAYGPLPPPPSIPARGVVLFGRLPRWAYAGLTRHLVQQGREVALWEPRRGGAVGVSPGLLGRLLTLRVVDG